MPQTWIPCSQAMPPNSDLVLVCLPGYGHDIEEQYGLAWWAKGKPGRWHIEALAYYEGKRFDMQTSGLERYITAWSPLPEPIVGKERKDKI